MGVDAYQVVRDARTFHELIERRSAMTPDSLMLVDDQGDMATFAEFRERVEAAAAGLLELGVVPESTVSWQLPNLTSTMVVLAALARLGIEQSPLLMGFREHELNTLLRQARPQHHLVHGVWREFDGEDLARTVIDRAGLATEILVIGGGLPTGDLTQIPSSVRPGRTLLSTSGTTGTPKLAVHTEESMIAGGVAQADRLFRPDDVIGVVGAVAHVGGPQVLAECLSYGLAALQVDKFHAWETAEYFRRHGVTVVISPPAGHLALVTAQLSQPETPLLPKLRFGLNGGASRPKPLHDSVRRHLGGRGLIGAYGMTETGSIAVPQVDDTDDELMNSGLPLPGLSLRVVGPDDNDVSDGEVGEIRVKGRMVCAGYLNPVDTAAAFDEQGFIRTGDLGRRHRDGRIEVTGRIKDLIIRKGENISAKEVEDVVGAMPQVHDVAVIGVPHPEIGEMVCAIVELAAGTSELQVSEVLEHCRTAGLMIQKVPERLEIVDALPRTLLGKIDKMRLRAAFHS